MEKEKEPKLWVTVLKLVIGAIIFIGVVGVGLYYTAEFDTYAPPDKSAAPDWGIATDSPIRNKR
jgi:hypothetical protein